MQDEVESLIDNIRRLTEISDINKSLETHLKAVAVVCATFDVEKKDAMDAFSQLFDVCVRAKALLEKTELDQFKN